MMNESAKGIFLPNTHLIYLCVPLRVFFPLCLLKKDQTGRTKLHLQCAQPAMGQKDGPDDIYSFLLPSLDNDNFSERRRDCGGELRERRLDAICGPVPFSPIVLGKVACSRVTGVLATFRNSFWDGRYAGNRNRCPNIIRTTKMKGGGRLRTMIVVMKDKPSSYLDIFGAVLLSYVVEMVDELGQCQYHTSFITLSTI